MKRKMKITISALAVMFVAAIAVAIASFSFAGNGNGDDALSDDLLLADASGSVSEKTIIDYIIDNSHSTDPDIDKMYHIVEITSNNASTLEDYALKNEGFRKYVIDGNRTIEELMAEGCVDYKSYLASVKDEESLKAISNADLIYVSNDGAKKFSKENDISEELYDVLHEYAVGSFKPLIIDSPTATVIDNDDSKSMADLAKNVFGPNEKYYYTFKWNSGMSASDYLSHASGSLYLGINGKTQLNNGVWKNVYDSAIQLDETGNIITTPVPAEQKLAKVLSVGVNETAYQKTTDILAGNTELPPGTNLYQIVTAEDGTKSVQTDTSTGKKVFYKREDNSIFSTHGYNARTEKRPNYIENDRVTLAELAQIDLDEYDMIILEDSCNNASVTSDIYKKLASAMYGKLHIVYDSAMGTATADNKTNITDGEKRDTKYNVLFFSVSTSDYVAKYDNIMVTNRNDFSLITTSASASTAKVIADLINASKYRGIGGSSSAASMFTVLELQPCYPIDKELAESKNKTMENGYSGDYYESPADVVNGKTKNELPEGTEYYAWELSKAKLADALDIPYNKIKLVQMSTEEFAGDKTEILGTYDMIYIGGNISSLRDDPQKFMALSNSSPYIRSTEALAKLPIYCMYSHNGDFVETGGAANHSVAEGNVLTSEVQKDGKIQSTFTYLNGNDITYNRYLALKDYIEKGMPVVVSGTAFRAYTMAKTKGYLQNSIDPDCNMYKVLAACEAQKTKTSENPTVVTDFKEDAVVEIYSDGTLGESQTGYVSVFASAAGSTSDSDSSATQVTGSKELLLQVYNAAKKKPKLTVKKMPATYNRFDSETILTDRTLKFEYDVANCSNYTVSLYIDDDGNSKFNKDKSGKEFMTSSNTGKLEYTCPTSFFGPVYWMLEVVDNDTDISVTQTGFSYIKNSSDEKQQVSVLQIMPEKGGGQTGNDSLYFCPICQRSSEILEYNPLFKENNYRYGQSQEYEQYYLDTKNTSGIWNKDISYTYWDPNKGQWGENVTVTKNTQIYFGKHEHDFGIATYDGGRALAGSDKKGTDEVYDNLASDIENLYDFDIDIIRRSEFEEWSRQVRDAYTKKVDTTKNTITDQAVSVADMRAEVKLGPATDAPGSEDFTQLLNEKIAKLDGATEIEKIDKLSDDDIQVLYVQKKKCDYAALANQYLLESQEKEETAEKEKEKLNAALDAMIADGRTPNTNPGVDSRINWVNELKQIRESEYYFDLYSMASRVMLTNDISSFYFSDGTDLDVLVSNYYKANDAKLEKKDLYKFYTRLAGGTDWINNCYSTVLLGPSESFNGDDITEPCALDDLEKYVRDGHQIVLFHDTLSAYADKGAVKLTARLRSYFGMDRYHMLSDAETEDSAKYSSNPVISGSDSNYVKYTSTDTNKYFMTNLSTRPRNDDKRYAAWNSESGINTDRYLTRVAYTDVQMIGDNGVRMKYAMPYRYATVNYAEQSTQIQDTQFDFGSSGKGFGTNRASQNNAGIVTTFPFTISKELNIGPTHGQAYAVDLEDDDMTVWYSLAAAYNTKTGSSMFAASPRDAMDSYFLYSYKNVFYCGAGHSDITGIRKDNNDERYLFINIICNSVRLSVNQPRINIYDYKTEENNIIKRKEDGSYETKVDEDTAYPEFSMKVTLDTSAKISRVRIYYDLDYLTNSSNEYTEDSNHIMVANWNVSNVQSGKRRDIWRYDSDLIPLRAKMENGQPVMNGKDYVWETEKYTGADGKESDQVMTRLKLQPSYFAPYNNEYTYLVIQVTDDAGNTVYQRIKIKLKPHLFDLT
ncbi:DUF5057 domain-containing protein [Eubacterium sp. MSJ-33]|uniref:DUF5057 domain-containing protein n=1 Tax=Eubacterium sp. MSJ-33 TaxID=2841528 RepID=UPI001C76E0CF|nr:DUF5057 domain-containing protein [Eubacterium sp. MSJ-33]QWT53222.1 DUF5057 domain-containing protein [Eubacterium sp. MSJ-33]